MAWKSAYLQFLVFLELLATPQIHVAQDEIIIFPSEKISTLTSALVIL
jgi:hypothetical protein